MPVLMQGEYDYLDTNRLAELLTESESQTPIDRGSILGGYSVQRLTFKVGSILPLGI